MSDVMDFPTGRARRRGGARIAGLLAMVAMALADGAIFSLAAAELPLPAGGNLDFDILRKGEVIGHYHSDFVKSDRGLEVHTRIKAEVTAGPVRLYNFSHNSTEIWRGPQLLSLTADTNDDGDIHHLQARSAESQMEILVDGKRQTTSALAVPSSLWTLAMVAESRPIFDITDGQLFKTAVQCESKPTAVTACELSGDLVRSLRYSSSGILDGLSFVADDGSSVLYRRQ